jgi:outer membrane protein assembly factor BamB
MQKECRIGRQLAGLALLLGLVGHAYAEESGWRGDGSGRFENAKPPTTWSKDSTNIVWKVEVGSGYSSPVVCNGRVFLTSQPSDVICLEAASGRELWRRPAGYEVALGAEEAARIATTRAELEAQKREIGKKYDQLRETDPDSPELEPWKEKRKAADDRLREFEDTFPPENRGGAGNAAATVACDGRRVFAIFGTGVIAALSVEGELLWIRHLEAPQQGFGHSASPLLASGHLIVHIQQLTALDLDTGETAWRADLPAKFGSPAVTKIAGQDVVITPSGALVNAANGQVLAEKQFSLSNNTPLIHDGVLYAHEDGEVKAFRLPDSLQTPLTLELLWETSATRDQRMASALFHEGLIYAGGRRGIMDVLDAATGDLIYRKRLDIGELFASPTMAGGYIFYPGRDGKMLVLQAGRTFEEVATNVSERLSTPPVFHGRHMYMRTDKSLYCIESQASDAN